MSVGGDLVYASDPDVRLPDGWRVVTITDVVGDCGVFCDGDWVESKDQDPNGDVRLIQLADIGVGAFRDRSDRYLTSNTAAALSCTYLQRGDILVARMPDPLGRACIFPGDGKKSVTVVDVAVIRPANPAVNARWLMHRINSQGFREAISSLQSGSTRMRISRRNLSRIAFPLPPLPMQVEAVQEIETQFSRLDEALANLQRVKANLKRYTDGMYGELFPGTPNVSLGDLLKEGPQNGLYVSKEFYGEGVPILRIDDYQIGWARPIRDLKRVRATANQIHIWGLREDDLVINRVNSVTHLGKCLRISAALSGAVFESNMMRVRLAPAALPKYVEHYLATRMGRERLTKNAKRAVNQASINQRDVCETPLWLPDLPTQQRVVAEVDRRLSVVRELEAEVDANLKRAQALRQAILAKAFSGSDA